MMKMLRYLGLTVIVVCLTAFASGCGGGGGGSAMMEEEEPPPVMVMECPQGQVGTYPDCMDPGPTDAELIAEAQGTIANIVTDAETRELAALAAYRAVLVHPDVTQAQIDLALDYAINAQTFSAEITAASAAANAATTPAQAETALADARASLADLLAAQTGVENIQIALQTPATPPPGQTETVFTGGSSLIKHLSDNKKVSDTILDGLTAASLLVGETDATTGSATYPYHKGDTPTQYPIPKDTDRGVLGVTVSVNGTDVSSNSQTGKISGSGRLSNGLDLKNTDGTRFATVYTDITVAQRVRQKEGNAATDTATEDDDSTMGVDERYQYVADDDYLLAGIWLDDTTAGVPVLRAFAYGSQPLTAEHDFCTAADVTNTSTLMRACGNETEKPFNTIAGFVDENESTEATYRGGVNGAYFAGGKASLFKANVSLTATFVRGAETDVAGSKISGEITSISAGSNSIAGSIDLKEVALENNISGAFGTGGAGGDAAGVIAGHAYNGSWKGQFFGMRARKLSPDTTGTTTYTPDEPDSVAGSFYVERLTVGEEGDDAAFIGAFGAHR